MSNANRIKIKLYWRREDGKNYIEIPINRGKEGRPWFLLQRVIEIMIVKKWVTPMQLFSYMWVRDSRQIREDLKKVDALIDLKVAQNGSKR